MLCKVCIKPNHSAVFVPCTQPYMLYHAIRMRNAIKICGYNGEHTSFKFPIFKQKLWSYIMSSLQHCTRFRQADKNYINLYQLTRSTSSVSHSTFSYARAKFWSVNLHRTGFSHSSAVFVFTWTITKITQYPILFAITNSKIAGGPKRRDLSFFWETLCADFCALFTLNLLYLLYMAI